MKTEFQLEFPGRPGHNGSIQIIGERPDNIPYVALSVTKSGNVQSEIHACIPDKDLELFAVNILKALKSKKLKV